MQQELHMVGVANLRSVADNSGEGRGRGIQKLECSAWYLAYSRVRSTGYAATIQIASLRCRHELTDCVRHVSSAYRCENRSDTPWAAGVRSRCDACSSQLPDKCLFLCEWNTS